MKKSELIKLIKEELDNQQPVDPKIQLKSDKKFLKDSLQTFNKISESLFFADKVEEACKKMKKIKEAASNVILTETDDDYDRMILNKNIKIMENTISDTEKSISDFRKAERRIVDNFDTFGRLIEKYFNVN